MAATNDDNLIAQLSGADPLSVADVVRQCVRRIRDGAWDNDGLLTVLEKIAALATDQNARVRQAVAESTPYLPERMFHALIGPLLNDSNSYVRNAAKDAETTMTSLKREAAKVEEHDQRIARYYRELEEKGARRLAERIAAHETEYFVRRMHHEAANALAALSASARALRADIDAGRFDRDALRMLVDRIDERATFVRHVLDNGRTNAKAVEPVFKAVALRAVVADEASQLSTRFPDRAARIAVDVTGVGDVTIEGDVGFLRQAIANVLRNAVEAYDANAARFVVRVTATETVTHVDLAIADEGCGMDAESIENAFVPFGSVKPGGTGFGLFIARRVARNVHGGELTIASAVGAGTTVTLTLPKRQEAAPVKKRNGRRAKIGM